MNVTALDLPQVRDYLRALDTALAGLRRDQVGDLREQITSHLEEALTPASAEHDVAEVLARLGTPAELAAEAAGQAPGSRPGLKLRVAGLGRRRLAALGAGLVVIVVLAAYVIVIETTGVLVNSGSEAWWFSQDRARQVDTSADGRSQSEVPIRSGQQQGFAIDLQNPSDLTQTVLGPPTGPNASTDSVGDVARPAIIGVNAPNWALDSGGFVTAGVRFVLPGDIPPHQTRLLRVLWTSKVCMQEKGDSIGIDEIVLRVRIGWITRTEVIPLDQGWYLGGPSTGNYSVPGKYCP